MTQPRFDCKYQTTDPRQIKSIPKISMAVQNESQDEDLAMKSCYSRREVLELGMGSAILAAYGREPAPENARPISVHPGGKPENITVSEVDKATVWVLTDNYYDALRPDIAIAKRYRASLGKSIHAEHGLAFYLETILDGITSACMFDFGMDPVGVINNIRLLNLDIGKVSAFVLSHGHLDHYTGAAEILRQNRKHIAGGTPFYVGEEAFLRRFTLRPGTDEVVDIGQLKKADIEDLGVKVVEVKNPTQIIPGVYVSGNIERVTTYEKTNPSLLVKRGDKPEPDDFRGEQALFFNIKGKGLVVLSGCAHAGIVNTVKHAQKIAGIENIHAIMGGFHLINTKPEKIQNTVEDIRTTKADFIIPTHCTGFEAEVAISMDLPNEFILNTAGTRYVFSA